MTNIEAIYPLSPMQQGMIFHTIEAPNSGVYCEQLTCIIEGNLNVLAFERAWQEIVRRHSVFRTLFLWENRQKPLQVVRNSVKLPWVNSDWRNLEHEVQQQSLESFLRDDRLRGFALERAPLMRCTLIQLSEETYQFIWTHHHLLIDGWCLSIILDEVFTFYEAFKQGQTLDLPSPRPYREYINWLQKQNSEGAKPFWEEELLNITAPTPLIVERAKKNNISQIEQGDNRFELLLSASLTDSLSTLTQRNCLTLSTLIQGAWAILLNRYSNESDVIFGATVSGRPVELEGVENMVGLFINTLPVRVKIDRETQVLSWLKKLQQRQVERAEYSYTPLVEIQGWSNIPRGLPLFESLVVFENYPIDASLATGKGDLQINQIETFDRTNYPLTLEVMPAEKLSLQISYDRSRFEADTIKRMLGHLTNLLESIATNPEQSISQLSLLSPAERHQLLFEWNETKAKYPKEKCIHQLFEEQVELTPDAVAVVFQEQQLTYKQLNDKANQLANYLQKLGVAPEVLVGICVERSVEMVVGLLGILKAGGAYVPLDPNYPPERLSYMLADSGVKVLLTQQSLLESLPHSQAEVICLDEDWGAISQHQKENLDARVGAENLAYVIYTSGSTGKPKGTMILHSGMVNYLSWCTKAYNVADGEGSTVNSSIGFDATITSLFSPLLVGGKVVLLPEEGEIEALKAALCSGTNFSLVKITPAHLKILSHLFASEEVTIENQAFIIGGEALSDKQTYFWQQYAPQMRLINEYGPTETVVGCCIYEVGKKAVTGSNIPIGRPISNTQIYILDSQLQPVPIGVPGELYIGGDGLARGYHKHPELTRAKFIPNPFNNCQSDRLYKTGDLARYLPDGNIEFLGRIDNQVKLRGFRIELGEIEASLNSHPQIQQGVVIATEDHPGNKRLVAYVVWSDESLSANKLREFLKSKLPEYMVPSAFVTLDNLPLTPNGKVDRQSLPAPDGEIIREPEYVAPRTAIELQLTQIWSEVLNITLVGVQDNFFELGGHSLLAVRLISQIQKHFQINLPLATLFQSPTIEQLGVVLGSDSSPKLWSPLVPIQPHGSLPPFFCVPGTGGNVLYFHHLARYLGSDRPFYGLQALGLDGETQPLQTIEEIAWQYIKAIQTVQPVGPYFLGGHSFGSIVAFEMANQLQSIGESVAYVAILDTPAPISQVDRKEDSSNWDDAKWICNIALIVEELFGENLKISHQALASLTPEEQINYFKEQLEMVGVLPPQADIKLVRGLLQVYRTQAQIDYLPDNASATPITLFCALEEKNSQQENSSDLFLEPAWGWNQFCDGEVEIHTVPGSHLSMMSEPHVKVLAEKLQKSLEQAQKNIN